MVTDRKELPKPFHDALVIVAEKLRDLPWVISGSAARWLRGFAVMPKDIDIDTGAEYAEQLRAVLQEWEVSPLAVPLPEKFPSVIGKYEIAGVQVELMVDVEIYAHGLHYVGKFTQYRDRIIHIPFEGCEIPVFPLEESILANIVLDRWHKLEEIMTSPALEKNFDLPYLLRRAQELTIPKALIKKLLSLRSSAP
jgi:hypothetical protein